MTCMLSMLHGGLHLEFTYVLCQCYMLNGFNAQYAKNYAGIIGTGTKNYNC